MLAVQLIDVEEATVVSDAWRLLSFADVLDNDGTDVIDGWPWRGQPCCR